MSRIDFSVNLSPLNTTVSKKVSSILSYLSASQGNRITLARLACLCLIEPVYTSCIAFLDSCDVCEVGTCSENGAMFRMWVCVAIYY